MCLSQDLFIEKFLLIFSLILHRSLATFNNLSHQITQINSNLRGYFCQMKESGYALALSFNSILSHPIALRLYRMSGSFFHPLQNSNSNKRSKSQTN